MWREGVSVELVAWSVNALALALGAGLGLRALIDPIWAKRLVRLTQDLERAGGFAEFRATYGGFFFGSHAFALLLSGVWLWAGAYEAGVYATSASAVLAAAWGCTGAGRVLSMLRDGTRTRFNMFSAGFEFAVALAIAAPHLAWWFSRPGL
jgi:Domain of unknown function (DUF4345)